MDRKIKIFIFVLFSASLLIATNSCQGFASSKRDEKEVFNVFEKYKKASIEGNGNLILDIVDKDSVAWYEAMIHDALTVKKRDLDNLNIFQKFMILRLRSEFNKAELEKMTGRDLLRIGVEKGWISKPTTSNLNISRVEIEGNYAHGYVSNGNETIRAFLFVKELGKWKFSIVGGIGIKVAVPYFEQSWKDSGLSEYDYVFSVLEMLSKWKIDKNILKGPRK